MATTKKIDTVQELTDKLAKSKSVVIADFTGIKHKQLEELRKEVRTAGGEFVVVKNKLFERALGQQAESVSTLLKNASAALFSYEDEVSPIKKLKAFFKTAGMGTAKGGLLGTVVLSETDVNKMADLPNRETLLGQLVRQLNSPIQGLHYALNWNISKFVYALEAIKNSKS